MAFLPVSAKMFFQDFSFDLANYKVERNSAIISTLQGLSNKDELGAHIAFLYGCDIKVGDVIINQSKRYSIKSIDYDTYNNEPEMIKAYY